MMTMARDEQRATAARLFEQGVTKAEIARVLKVAPSTAARWLPAGNRTPEGQARVATMRKMRDEGQTYEVIGAAYGVTKAQVSQMIGPKRRAERGRTRHFNLSDDRWRALERTAHGLGLIYADGSDGGRGNIVLMLDAAAKGELGIAWQPGHGGMGDA